MASPFPPEAADYLAFLLNPPNFSDLTTNPFLLAAGPTCLLPPVLLEELGDFTLSELHLVHFLLQFWAVRGISVLLRMKLGACVTQVGKGCLFPVADVTPA